MGRPHMPATDWCNKQNGALCTYCAVSLPIKHLWPFMQPVKNIIRYKYSVDRDERRGIFIDCDLSMRTHMTRTVLRCFAVLRQLRQILHSLVAAIFKTLLIALVHSRLDYGNAVMRQGDWCTTVVTTIGSRHSCAICTGCAFLNASSSVWLFLCSAAVTRPHLNTSRETFSGSLPSSRSPLASFLTRSVFHSELKTWLFTKSFPP